MNTYCIECENYVDELLGIGKIAFHFKYPEWDVDRCDIECEGPFAYCPPPPPEELPFWSWELQIPSSDELAEMDVTAVELLTEFELV